MRATKISIKNFLHAAFLSSLVLYKFFNLFGNCILHQCWLSNGIMCRQWPQNHRWIFKFETLFNHLF